ncbi:MAG: hypothetical protein K6G75_08330 [Lachnospiraceae bacterium]|nr:hypothetical protein [Lachnospiraceae bacterium]
MFNIFIGNLIRLVKNILFSGGCVLAIVITYFLTSGKLFEFLSNATAEERMIFTSAAMVAYFSFFTTIFVSVEYHDGIIRNRIISGFSQIDVYLASLLTQYSALTIMFVVYIIGGLIGGARLTSDGIIRIGIIYLALIAYVTVTNAVGFRVKKVIISTIITMLIFNACFNMVMFGNAILSFMENETALAVGKVIYNINALGQWFSLTPFSFDYTNPGYGVQIALSFGIIVPTLLLGMVGLKKRELK